MKTKKINLLWAAALLTVVACNDDQVNAPAVPDTDPTLATVTFDLDATPLDHHVSALRSFGPTIGKEGFRILAFKKAADGTDYIYTQDVPTAGMSANGNKLTGIAQLPIGEYKFIPTYGLANSSAYAWPQLNASSTPLTDDLMLTHNTIDGTSAIFLERRDLNSIPSYSLGLTPDPNPTVTSTLTRAVSRIDVLFLQATKSGDTYTEISGPTDVFGNVTPASIEMQLKTMNQTTSLVGTPGTASTFDGNYTIADMANAVVIGNGSTTIVGTDAFTDYDNVTADAIKAGSAHVQGAYVLPNADNTPTGELTLVVSKDNETVRTIPITAKLPVERNKVTLVKVYVLGGTVFDTNVTFEVTVDTAWDGYNEVTGEVN